MSASPTARSAAPAATPTRALPPAATPSALPTTARPTAVPTASPTANPGPFPSAGEARCGLLLPVVSTQPLPPRYSLDSSQPLQTVPEDARPAVQRILEAPHTVGLAAYELGRENEGVYLNADVPMPLASVVKVIHLLAYAQAVQEGELDPQSLVPLADLERYLLPGSDLGAHDRALSALRAEGAITGTLPSVPLAAVPRMMIEFSSNAATDYLHTRLGQRALEQAIINLSLTSHTAPCPFLGQFLLMSQGGPSITSLIANPARFSRQVMEVGEAYAYTGERWQRPSFATQMRFTAHLNTRASSADYAKVMGLIGDNQLGPWEQNVRIRRYMEWPTFSETNQAHLAWLGYKGGSLPGVLTAVYYAQPWDRARPVVVALFYRDLPEDTYRSWRRSLPNDELARWLLYDRDAIAILSQLISP